MTNFHKYACLIWKMAGGDDDDKSIVNIEMGYEEKMLKYLKQSETLTTLQDFFIIINNHKYS